jgi:hypothetical protein
MAGSIFRRNGIYYARLRTSWSHKYITRSLKTSSEQTAIDLGRRLLFQLEQRAEACLRNLNHSQPSLTTTSGTVSGIIVTVARPQEC